MCYLIHVAGEFMSTLCVWILVAARFSLLMAVHVQERWHWITIYKSRLLSFLLCDSVNNKLTQRLVTQKEEVTTILL